MRSTKVLVVCFVDVVVVAVRAIILILRNENTMFIETNNKECEKKMTVLACFIGGE